MIRQKLWANNYIFNKSSASAQISDRVELQWIQMTQ